MRQLLEIFNEILTHGVPLKEDRTGHGRLRRLGIMKRFDISDGKMPLVTTRKINPMVAVHETLMFIAGVTNVNYLNERGVKIWDSWAVNDNTPINYVKKLEKAGYVQPEQALVALGQFDSSIKGEIGPMYGYMWRHWPLANRDIHRPAVIRTPADMPSDFVKRMTDIYGSLEENDKKEMTLDQWLVVHYYSAVDQLNELVQNLKKNPYSSRHVVTAFNPESNPVDGYSPDENVLMGRGALMPCHFAFQVHVDPPQEEGKKPRLSLKFHIRSNDAAVGLPFNIAGYALLAHLLAHVCDFETHELVYDGGDVHLYHDHLEGVKQQMSNIPLGDSKITINPDQKDLFAIQASDITIEGYQSHPPIKYPVAV